MTAHDVGRILPDIATVRRRSLAMAMVDAIVEADASMRYYHFDPAWSATEEMASMDNGSGDEYSIVFSSAGAYLRGFDHESPMSPWARNDLAPWPGVVTDVPPTLVEYVTEPAFTLDGVPSVTVCLWRETDDESWHAGDITWPTRGTDGADWMLGLLADGTPERYRSWAAQYYETDLSIDLLRDVYDLIPLTPAIVHGLAPRSDWDRVAGEAATMGYPVA